MIQIMDDCIVSEHTILFRDIEVSLVDKEKAQKIRNEARMGTSQIFRRALKTIINENEEDMTYDWQVHHILPVRLGGTNAVHNLALVEPNFHRVLHEIFSRQTRGMERGEVRTIHQPYMHGQIWGL